MKKLIIIGGEGHGTVITSCIKDNEKYFNAKEWEIVGFLNDFEKKIGSYPVVGKLDKSTIQSYIERGYYFAWGIHLIGRNILTRKIFDRLEIPENRLATIIHHSAFIAEDVVISPGVLIMSHTYVGARTVLGVATMVKSNVCIGHDVESAPLCHFAMGSITGSYSQLGICSDVAIGATTLESVIIGDYAMAGAKSLITKDIPDKQIHIGIPARFLKKIKED